MSGIPKQIPELGDTAQTPRQNPDFNPANAGAFTSEDYFVFSRVDGALSLHDLILMTGFDTDRSISILNRLHSCGAILLPGETQPSQAKLTAEPEKRKPAGDAKPAPELRALDPASLSESERAAFEEDVPLSEPERLRVLQMLRLIQGADYFAFLGVERDVNKRQLKRAYFRLSKEFHPDRYYAKQLGSFTPWLARIFETATQAFEVLSHDRSRHEYEARLRGEMISPARARTQTRAEHAAQMFETACGHEVRGELPEALRLFGAAIRVDPKSRYMRRAAACAISAGEFTAAIEYAKNGADLEPGDPSYTRVLADAFRAGGKLAEAESALVHALSIKSENDVLAGELQKELEEVRKML